MQPDLPWNVAGISSEAREAARAAARREGLSVGEWLTRRILPLGSEAAEPTRTEWSSRQPEPRPEPRPAGRRDTDDMLDHVSRSESETAEVYRRIEEQLRGMSRRLDASERNQTESNRVMSKAAVEMNIASREQAQAFDQLGAYVTNMNDRLDRVEHRDSGEGLRDAVKALHQGLSRLADQISQTASQSASQISALAGNLENVAGRIGQARMEAHGTMQALEGRIAVLDERVSAVEKAAQANAGSVDRALEALSKQDNGEAEAIARLEDSVRRLESRGPDPALDRRLGGIERALAEIVARAEPQNDGVEIMLDKVMQRLDALETTQQETADELRKAAAEKEKPAAPPQPQPAPLPQTSALPPQPAPADTIGLIAEPPPAVASYSPMPEMPPFADMLDAPPPIADEPKSFAAAPPAFDPGPPPPFEAAAAPGFQAEPPPAPTVENYLSAARRSARAAAAVEAERAGSLGSLRWNAAAKPEKKGKTRPLLVAIIVLVGIAIIAGMILSRQESEPLPPPSQQAEPVKPAPAEQPAAKEQTSESTETVPAESKPAETQSATPAPAKAAPKPAAKTTPAPPPAQTQVKPAQQATASPRPLQQQPAARPTAPLDRLTALANAGNARAQLVVGLKYLESTPVNEKEAAKWLQRAADAGEPVAQYRLGTLYERGRGVPTDAAKAMRWYQAAANQGNRKAMHNLAVAFAEGTGVQKDFAEASRWFLRAANLGLPDSQFNLAVLYERGLGVPQNLVDAYKWYAIAAAQGDGESKTRLNAISSQLSPEERSAAQNAARSFRAGALNARANVAPTVAEVTRG